MTGDVVTGLGDFGPEVSSNRCGGDEGTKGFLPHFSQVWSGQEMMFNGANHMAGVPGGTCLPNIATASNQSETGLQSAAMCRYMFAFTDLGEIYLFILNVEICLE